MQVQWISTHIVQAGTAYSRAHLDQNLHLIILVVNQRFKPFLFNLIQFDLPGDHRLGLNLPLRSSD